jgi:hypothetical protein
MPSSQRPTADHEVHRQRRDGHMEPPEPIDPDRRQRTGRPCQDAVEGADSRSGRLRVSSSAPAVARATACGRTCASSRGSCTSLGGYYATAVGPTSHASPEDAPRCPVSRRRHPFSTGRSRVARPCRVVVRVREPRPWPQAARRAHKSVAPRPLAHLEEPQELSTR